MTNHGILEIAGSAYGDYSEQRASPWMEFIQNISDIGISLETSVNQMLIGN